jgi:DNA-binding CsgD family transcriptional regulator
MAPTGQDQRWYDSEAVPAGDRVAVSALPVGQRWRSGGLDERRVVTLAAAGAVSPLLVRRVDHLVVDGAHRLGAARRLGLHTVPVEWFEGSALDVARAFIDRNDRDGTPIVTPDRDALLAWVLREEPAWSDRLIAASCGVSPKSVARQRRGDEEPAGEIARRIGRDGRARPARAGLVREQVVAALEASPGASLRAIAQQLGVSPETVRSVRRSLADRDEAPAPRPVAAPVPSWVPSPIAPRPQPTWQDDRAFQSTASGCSFVDWFESTQVDAIGERKRASEVPLSRVYEVADEALRRAAFWKSFAEDLEARTRPARAGLSRG